MSLKKIIVLMALAALFLSFEVVADAETENATLAANEAVVTTFDELKKAISENNGIDTVYLGADIPLSSGIKIPDAKKTFTLSGKNPVTNEIHTLTETMASAGAQSSVITVDTNNGAKETTLKDINIIGKNYYGTISVLGAAKNVVQNYENIHYQGPQLIYNLNGVAVFSGDNDIRIASVVSGSAAANE
ncbi:putative secreted protein, partial [Listeria ivanovii FSL F6-596]